MNVCVSGYFDPIHVGHVEYFKLAKEYAGEDGKLIVIVNNDRQAILKKKKFFMPENERLIIVQSIKYVDEAILSIDEDRTVRESIKKAIDLFNVDVFANGGDQKNNSIPEAYICHELNIQLIDNLGDKIQSSSWLTGIACNL